MSFRAPKNGYGSSSGGFFRPHPIQPTRTLPVILPTGWSQHFTPDGRIYYHDSKSGQTTWQPPNPDVVDPLAPGWETTRAPDGRVYYYHTQTHETTYERPTLEKYKERMRKEAQEAKSKELGKKIVHKAKIGNTAWTMCRAGNNKIFYYNRESKVSMWEKPSDVEGIPLPKLPEVDMDQPLLKRIKIDDEDDIKDSVSMTFESGTSGDDKPTNSHSQEDDEDEEEDFGVRRKKDNFSEAPLSDQEKALLKQLSHQQIEQQFMNMLEQANVSAFGTWSAEYPKFRQDPRVRFLQGKARHQAFSKYQQQLEMKEKEARIQKRKMIKQDYLNLLKSANLTPKSLWNEFRNKHLRHPQFLALEKMMEKEQLFREFISDLKRQEKNAQKTPQQIRSDFLAYLKSRKVKETSNWDDVKVKLSSDARFQAVPYDKRYDLFREYQELCREGSGDYARAESLRLRKLEVEKEKSKSVKDSHRNLHHIQREEARDVFQSMLIDHIRPKQSHLRWRAAQSILKEDERWKSIELVDERSKEKLYYQHVDKFVNLKRDHFRKAILDHDVLTLTSSWEDCHAVLEGTDAFDKFGHDDDERQREFERFQRERVAKAFDEFRDLLQETKCITYLSWSQVQDDIEHAPHMKEILLSLEKDNRYHILQFQEQKRQQILIDYLKELDQGGAPPPPTASIPDEHNSK